MSTKPCFVDENRSMPLCFICFDILLHQTISLTFTEYVFKEMSMNGCMLCFFNDMSGVDIKDGIQCLNS